MNAFTQCFARHFSEQRENAHVASAHSRDCAKKQDYEYEYGNSQADESKQATAMATSAVNNSAASWIENRHRSSPGEILWWTIRVDKWLLGLRSFGEQD
jgi:hypothetical protein